MRYTFRIYAPGDDSSAIRASGPRERRSWTSSGGRRTAGDWDNAEFGILQEPQQRQPLVDEKSNLV